MLQADIRLIKRYYVFMQPHLRLAIIVVALMAVSSAIGLGLPYLSKFVFDEGILEKNMRYLLMVAGIGFGAMVVRFVVNSIQAYCLYRYTNRTDFLLKEVLFRKLLFLPLAEIDRFKSAYLLHHVESTMRGVSPLRPTTLGKDIVDCFSMIGVVVILLKLNVLLFLSGIAFSGMYFLYASRIGARERKLNLELQEMQGQQRGSVIETIDGLQLIKASGTEEREIKRYCRHLTALIQIGYKQFRFGLLTGGVDSLLSSLVPLLILCIGAYMVARDRLTIGTLVAFNIYFGQLSGSVTKLNRTNLKIRESMVHLHRFFAILDKQPETSAGDGTHEVSSFRESIRFENVCFAYRSGVPVLKGVSFEIPRGSTTAIVGPTGVGKTTLAKLILRLYEPQEGAIYLDGRRFEELDLKSLRRLIGLVPQEAFLFDLSVEFNIAYRMEQTVPRSRILDAAMKAEAHEFIEALPDGYEALIGSRGKFLSSGQKQRIALARELLYSPQLLILDEACASVDARTESRIMEAIKKFDKQMTVVIITHRLSSIIDADRIIVLDKGTVAAVGTHSELIERCALYRDLVMKQNLFPRRPQAEDSRTEKYNFLKAAQR